MMVRIWWFVIGAIAGGIVTVRALRNKPTPVQIRDAVISTGADVLDMTARAVRPKRTR